MQTLRMLFKELGLGVIVEVIIVLGNWFINNLTAISSFFSVVVPISIVTLPAYFIYLVFFKYNRLIKVIRNNKFGNGVTHYAKLLTGKKMKCTVIANYDSQD